MFEFPKIKPMPRNDDYPEVRIDHKGDRTYVYINGVIFGHGVNKVTFEHDKSKDWPTMTLEFDVRSDLMYIPVEKEGGNQVE